MAAAARGGKAGAKIGQDNVSYLRGEWRIEDFGI
jgi:hypothetical protein